jgi:hypothetical protein
MLLTTKKLSSRIAGSAAAAGDDAAGMQAAAAKAAVASLNSLVNRITEPLLQRFLAPPPFCQALPAHIRDCQHLLLVSRTFTRAVSFSYRLKTKS